MSEGKVREQEAEEYVWQDGCRGPRKAPWPPWISRLTALPFAAMFCLGAYILYSSSTVRLAIWLGVIAFAVFPGRYLLCARCPYYGQRCSTLLGLFTPFLHKKQEGKSMKLGLWLDLLEMIALFLIPIVDAWRVGGAWMLALWILVSAGAFLTLTRLACPSCSFTFCPIGRAGRAFGRR